MFRKYLTSIKPQKRSQGVLVNLLSCANNIKDSYLLNFQSFKTINFYNRQTSRKRYYIGNSCNKYQSLSFMRISYYYESKIQKVLQLPEVWESLSYSQDRKSGIYQKRYSNSETFETSHVKSRLNSYIQLRNKGIREDMGILAQKEKKGCTWK